MVCGENDNDNYMLQFLYVQNACAQVQVGAMMQGLRTKVN